MTLVVDAGVACKWFVAEAGSPQAVILLEREEGLIAPEIVVAEVANALWRKLRSGEMTSNQAAGAVGELPGFFDDLVPCVRLAARSLALAADLHHPVHDCLSLALAELREASLVTADQRRGNGRWSPERWATGAPGRPGPRSWRSAGEGLFSILRLNNVLYIF